MSRFFVKEVTDVSDVGTGYDSLGEFIGARTPYGKKTKLPAFGALSLNAALDLTDASQPAAVPIPAVYGSNKIVVESGLHKDHHAENPAVAKTEKKLLGELELDDMKKLMHWNFNGVDHQVTKAIRIWYTYEADDPENPGATKTVGTFLLLGFVGNGHP